MNNIYIPVRFFSVDEANALVPHLTELFGSIRPQIQQARRLTEQLAELGLQLAGMTPAEARAFSQSVDWTSTLVVPIPRNAAAVKQVSVDGVTGTVIYRSYDDGVPQHYTLLWVKNDIVYALAGFGTADQAVALASSIQ